MIPVKKFLSLEPKVRERKLWRILLQLETALRASPLEGEPDKGREDADGTRRLVADTLTFLAALPGEVWPVDRPPGLSHLIAGQLGGDERLRLVNDLRHDLAIRIGREAAEWDLFPPVDPVAGGARGADKLVAPLPSWLSPAGGPSGARLVYCDAIRSPFNTGSIFRTASAFGLDGVVLSSDCPDPQHPRFARSAMGTVDHLAWERAVGIGDTGLAWLMERTGLPCFALELGGTPLADFAFPTAGIVVLGSEELGIRPEILERCRSSGGVVSIPLPGPKASLNVGVSFGILAAEWVERED